ncbi:hypothetical protein [Chryseobacterium lactis]|uniref:hypothetical protein n=1 Tax=Chryseobacterium lactis TaxID=1241981 RepID=UPI001623F6C8|nr:hypothetical protein [Chryseobacterium lactis]
MKITIPKPCHENWENMTPDEKGRFCAVCSKTVRDFSKVPDDKIIDFFSSSSENICGNFNTSQLNRDLHYSYINSVFVKFAVGFTLTTGGLVSVYAQQNNVSDTLKTEEIQEIVFPRLNNSKKHELLGSVSIVPAAALANKSEKEAKMPGLIVDQLPKDHSEMHTLRIGRAKTTLRDEQKPLCVINGKISSLEELQMIDPKMIKTMNVLKEGTAEYGEKAKNGVIVVTTKRKEKFRK